MCFVTREKEHAGYKHSSSLMLKKETENYIPSVSSNNSPSPISVLEIIGTATRGGMENQIVNLLKHLPRGRFRITCICPCESRFTETLRKMGVEAVYITPLADNPDWRSVQTAIEVCKLHQVDIIHAHMPKSHVLAAITGSLIRKPVIATVHGMHVTAHELGIALAAKSHLITNCQETYIQALALGVPKERVRLFHNGVDTTIFHPGIQGNTFRKRIGVDENAVLIGFAGRLEHEKGPDLFVKAAGYIHEFLPHVHFAIAGDGSMTPSLKKLARHLQLDKHLHFADWAVDTPQVYPAFDIMAHTSRSDGTSLVLLEAMACGVPVVGMAVGGVREMIANEHSGMQTEPGDCEAVARQIVQLIKHPELLEQMSIAAVQRVEQYFNVVTNAALTAGLIEAVAAGHLQTDESSTDQLLLVNSNGSLKATG